MLAINNQVANKWHKQVTQDNEAIESTMMIMMISSVIKILIPTNWTEAAEFSSLSNTHKLGLEGMNVICSVVSSFGDESHADQQ